MYEWYRLLVTPLSICYIHSSTTVRWGEEMVENWRRIDEVKRLSYNKIAQIT